MPPKRKADTSSSSSKPLALKFVEGNNYAPAGKASLSHPAKRARIEGPEGDEDAGEEVPGEEEVNPGKPANAEEGKGKKKRARTVVGSKKASRTQNSNGEVQAQAALRGPVGTAKRPKAAKGTKVKAAAEEAIIHEEVERREAVAESEQDTQTQSQPLEELELDELDELDELIHTPDESQPAPHSLSVSPAQDVSPPALSYPAPLHPHPYYGHPYPHASHPYTPGAYPPHPHFAPPPGAVDTPGSTTVDTTPGGSFQSHSSYADTNAAPSGNPFPPQVPHSLYAPPAYGVPAHQHPEGEERPTGEEPDEPVVKKYPPGMPYKGADGRKRVPVKPTAQRTSRADHVACQFCRGRKLKCDGRRPSCGHCGLRNIACHYDEFIRRRGPGKKEKNDKKKETAIAGPGGEGANPTPGPSTSATHVEMHLHTIDPSLPPDRIDDNHGAESRPHPSLSVSATPPPPPRPHRGPMPTPDPPKNPQKRRRTTGQSIMMNPAMFTLRDEVGLKPSMTAYEVGSNEKMGVSTRRSRGTGQVPSFYHLPGHPGHHAGAGGSGSYTPGAYARQGPVGEVLEEGHTDESYGIEEDDDDDDDEGYPVEYAQDARAGWPAEPPGGEM